MKRPNESLLDQEEFFWFPVCLHAPQLPLNFRLVWTEACTSHPFVPAPQSGFCAKPSEASWLNRAVAHAIDSLRWLFTETGLWVHKNTLAEKQPWGKKVCLSFSKDQLTPYI